MRKISKTTLKILEVDVRMKRCCLQFLGGCTQTIQFHHNLIYAGRQSDLPNTILGVCELHHAMARNKDIKELLDWIMLNQMTERDFSLLSKATLSLKTRRSYLNKKYGQYKC